MVVEDPSDWCLRLRRFVMPKLGSPFRNILLINLFTLQAATLGPDFRKILGKILSLA